MNNYVYEVMAYDSIDNHTYVNGTGCYILALTEPEAIETAKSMINRKEYRVQNIKEMAVHNPNEQYMAKMIELMGKMPCDKEDGCK